MFVFTGFFSATALLMTGGQCVVRGYGTSRDNRCFRNEPCMTSRTPVVNILSVYLDSMHLFCNFGQPHACYQGKVDSTPD